MPKQKQHHTYHYIDPDKDGKVRARCDACDWSELIDVSNLSWVEGMEKIFAARDKHEEEANTNA